jgi:hypothetical protein
VKSEASTLYRAKNFVAASAAITAAAPAVSGDVQELRTLAAIYAQLGKAYSIGMSPGSKATDAYVYLLRARDLDRELGASYVTEIELRLANVAPRAAVAYTAAKEYGSAFQAVRLADALGSTSATSKSVRENLEVLAADLYRAAQSEMTGFPEEAKKKLRLVLSMVDPKSPLAAKTTKLLAP